MKPLVPSPGGVPLAFARTPLARDVHRDRLPFGLTVAEIARTIPDLPDRFWTHGRATLSFEYRGKAYCELVPPAMWGSLRLSEKPVAVHLDLHIPLGGGGGGSGGGQGRKSTFALIAAIALVAATTAVSAGALGPVTGGLLAAGSWQASVAAAGVGIIGGLALTALTPPPTFAAGKDEDDRVSGTASASGNQLDPGGVIPRVIGTSRAFPSLACLPLVDQVGDDEIVEAVFAMAGPHRWQGIRVDKIPIGSDEAFEHESREGWDDDTPLTLVTRQGFTDAQPQELSNTQVDTEDQGSLKDQAHPENSIQKWHTFVSRRSPDEFWLTLLFPEGLFRNDGADVLVPVRLRMRVRGTTTWINLPEVHFGWNGSSSFKQMVKLKWSDGPAEMPEPLTNFAPVNAYKRVPISTVDPAGLGGWTADSYFSSGSGDDLLSTDTFATSKVLHTALYDNRVEFYLGSKDDPFGTFGAAGTFGAVWEVQVKRGQSFKPESFEAETYSYEDDTTGVFDFFSYFDADGLHQVFGGQKQTHSKIVVARIASVWNEHPIAGTGLALLAVKAKNKAVQNVSALLSGYVPLIGVPLIGGPPVDPDDPDPGDDTAPPEGWGTTSNPAPHYRYILTGGLNVDPLPDELIDDDGLSAWAERCEADGLRCDMIADGKNADELLKVVASCGFARPRQSETWGVVQDYDRSGEAPVQIFTPRNLARFGFQKAFPLLPHGLRVRYRDRQRDYEDAPALTIYDAGYSADGADDTLAAERFEEVTYEGLTSEHDASQRAIFDLAQARLRTTIYSGEADAEALVATKGDLVGVQHDILARQAGFARVKEKITDSGNVIGLMLDSKIPTALGGDFFSIEDLFTTADIFALEGTTGIAIRMKDGTGVVVAQELSDPTGYVEEVTFDTPFADPGDELDAGCLVASGELGSEYRRLILSDVQPAPDLRAALTFVDEAPSLFPLSGIGDGSFDDSFDSSFA